MSFLSTFFNVGKYSDREIAEAAGLYYGLGPIDSAAVSASAANAEANVTVNVNIGEQTTGSKQYVPERAHDGEYHVIYKNRDDTSPAPTNSKKAEAKPEPPKPKAEKTAEKAPAQPQPKQENADKAQTKTSDLKKNLEDAKNAFLQPDTSANESKPESKQESKSEEKPEPLKPKAEKTAEKAPAQPQPKQEKPEPPKPKAEKTAEKAPAQPQPKPVEVTGQQAAHALNGFDYTRFQAQPPAVAPPAPQQPTIPTPMPVIPVPVYPANYRELMPEERCDRLVGAINRGLMPPMNNPRPGMTVFQKVDELEKHITFMDNPDRQVGEIRINSLLNLLDSPSLKNAMRRNDAVDRANNPKLSEVPVSKYATGEQVARFDMAFEVKLKDPKKVLVVLYSTVPSYDPIQNAWSGDLTFFTKDQ